MLFFEHYHFQNVTAEVIAVEVQSGHATTGVGNGHASSDDGGVDEELISFKL